MKSIAITGGIATGKSTATGALITALGESNCQYFDCDTEAHNLLTSDVIIATVRRKFGGEVIDPDGSVNRSALRNIVFENDARRLELEELLHPEILNSAENALATARDSEDPPSWFVMEIPLLYEVDFPIARDLEIVIAASQNTQIDRLIEKRNLDPDSIEKLIAAQLPIIQKIGRADVAIWNDGSTQEFTQQIELLSRALKTHTILFR